MPDSFPNSLKDETPKQALNEKDTNPPEFVFTYVSSRSSKKKKQRGKPACFELLPKTDCIEKDTSLKQHDIESDSGCVSAGQAHASFGTGFTYVEAQSTKKQVGRRKGRSYKLGPHLKPLESTCDMMEKKRKSIRRGYWMEQSSSK